MCMPFVGMNTTSIDETKDNPVRITTELLELPAFSPVDGAIILNMIK